MNIFRLTIVYSHVNLASRYFIGVIVLIYKFDAIFFYFSESGKTTNRSVLRKYNNMFDVSSENVQDSFWVSDRHQRCWHGRRQQGYRGKKCMYMLYTIWLYDIILSTFVHKKIYRTRIVACGSGHESRSRVPGPEWE